MAVARGQRTGATEVVPPKKPNGVAKRKPPTSEGTCTPRGRRSREQVENLLSKYLSPASISWRTGRGQGQVPYVEGHVVIQYMNAIFGVGGWTSTTDEIIREVMDQDPKTGIWTATYRAKVTVRAFVDGETWVRQGTGTGSSTGKKLGEVLEGLIKTVETDALKRAAREFGPALGNCLYSASYRKWAQQNPQEGAIRVWSAKDLLCVSVGGVPVLTGDVLPPGSGSSEEKPGVYSERTVLLRKVAETDCVQNWGLR